MLFEVAVGLASSIILMIGIIYILLIILTPKKKPYEKEEDYYINPNKNQKEKFENILEKKAKGDIDLSVVFPAYNEEKRIKQTIEDALAFLNKRKEKTNKKFEIIIVSDGSKDKTFEISLNYSKMYSSDVVRVLNLVRNRGKGGAVTQGMLRARGNLILFADADGATDIQDLDKLEKEIRKIQKSEIGIEKEKNKKEKETETEEFGYGIAVGSRHHLVQTDAVVKRSFIRNLLMRVFHFVVYILGVKNIQDTQCGFKLFTRKSASLILPNMHVEGWIFDIELLVLANYFKIPVAEVGVNWREIPGSKLDIVVDSFKMLKDLFVIRFNYALLRWNVSHNPTLDLIKKNN